MQEDNDFCYYNAAGQNFPLKHLTVLPRPCEILLLNSKRCHTGGDLEKGIWPEGFFSYRQLPSVCLSGLAAEDFLQAPQLCSKLYSSYD